MKFNLHKSGLFPKSRNQSTANMKLSIFPADLTSEQLIEFTEQGIKAGFPSVAQDYATESIDLNRELIRHPATTFYARTVGDSMLNSGIGDGDLLVIDKGIEPNDGDIIVAYIDGEFTLKRFVRDAESNCVWLMPENDEYQPIRITQENEFIIWGVLTYNIKCQLRRLRK